MGLHLATVSDILNRGHANRYNAQTQQRVRDAAARLGYTPSRSAQRLSRGRSNEVGVVLTRHLDDPYFGRLVQALQAELAQSRLQMSLVTPPSSAHIEGGDAPAVPNFGRQLLGDSVEAAIVGPFYCGLESHRKQARLLASAGVPVVTFGGVGGVADYDEVALDHRAAGLDAVRALLELGHRRIGVFGGAVEAGDSTFAGGAAAALREAGLLDASLFHDVPDTGRMADCRRAADVFLDRRETVEANGRTTAVLCRNDRHALSLLFACQARGIAVPRDLSLVGFNDSEEAACCFPTLASFDPRCGEQARRLVALVGARLAEPAEGVASPPRVELVRPSLVLRDSVGPPAARA